MKTTDIINDVEDIMHNKAFLPVRTYLLVMKIFIV